jgi:hypothetical protein
MITLSQLLADQRMGIRYPAAFVARVQQKAAADQLTYLRLRQGDKNPG